MPVLMQRSSFMRDIATAYHRAESAKLPSVLIDAPEAARLMGITLMAFQQRVQRGKIPRSAIIRSGRRVQFVRARLPGIAK